MTTKKGGRPSTGSIKWQRCSSAKCAEKYEHPLGMPHWHGRVTKADGSRPFVPLDPSIGEGDEERARTCAIETAEWFRENPQVDAGIRETVAQYAKTWLDDRDGRINSIRDDRSRLKLHVLPILGPLDVTKFTRDDVERVRDDLDRKILRADLSWKTAASVWTLITSLCADMVNAKKRELRRRSDNPCHDVKPPERGARKAKQYLYPSEFLTFISCRKVPLRWRRAVALAVYLFPRDGELQALRWDDIDLEHGVISITKALNGRTGKVESTKSGETRRFAIEPNLLPLLEGMHDAAKGKGGVVGWHELHMSRGLRRWLKVAKVERTALHNGTPTQKPLTWHDLRASGLTWLAVRGDDPLKIRQRAGHSTFSTTELYIREAEAVRDGFGEVFPPLPDCLLNPIGGGSAEDWQKPNPELETLVKTAVSRAGHGSRTLPGVRADHTGKPGQPSDVPIAIDSEPGPSSKGPAGDSPGSTLPNAKPIDLATLRAKLDAAILSEAWDAVKAIRERMVQVEREAAGNVRSIDEARAKLR